MLLSSLVGLVLAVWLQGVSVVRRHRRMRNGVQGLHGAGRGRQVDLARWDAGDDARDAHCVLCVRLRGDHDQSRNARRHSPCHPPFCADHRTVGCINCGGEHRDGDNDRELISSACLSPASCSPRLTRRGTLRQRTFENDRGFRDGRCSPDPLEHCRRVHVGDAGRAHAGICRMGGHVLHGISVRACVRIHRICDRAQEEGR